MVLRLKNEVVIVLVTFLMQQFIWLFSFFPFKILAPGMGLLTFIVDILETPQTCPFVCLLGESILAQVTNLYQLLG